MSAIDVEKIKLELFDEVDDRQHQMKLLFGCGLYAAFRGSSEHTNFCKEQISFGTYPDTYENPVLAGKPFVCIDNFGNDKTKTITCTNSYSHDTSQVLRFPIEIENPKCFGGTVAHYYRKPSPGQSCMYCMIAPKGYRDKMKEDGYPDAAFYPLRQLGRHSIAELFREGGLKLGLPDGFKPHALRSACITQLVNDQSVSIAETMAVARHTSVSASKTYQRVDGISEGNRLRALGLLPGTSAVAATREATPKPSSVQVLPPCAAMTAPVKGLSDSGTDTVQEVDDDGIEWVDLNNKGSDSPVDDAENENLVPCTQVPSMTQIGILELEDEVKNLKSRLKPRKPPVMSQNRRDLEKLREIVRGLKRDLDSREHDILYYRSMENDQDEKLQHMSRELDIQKTQNFQLEEDLKVSECKRRKLKQENDELERFVFGKKQSKTRCSTFV